MIFFCPERLRISLFVILLLSSSLCYAQQLTIQNDNGKQTVPERTDIEALPHVKVQTTTSSSSATTFEGVSLHSVLEKAGVTFAETMKGKRLASCLLVGASDGYHAVIALPEVDPAFTDRQVVLAFLKDGKPLDQNEGPYRIVIPDEKRMARWVRQVTTMKIVIVE